MECIGMAGMTLEKEAVEDIWSGQNGTYFSSNSSKAVIPAKAGIQNVLVTGFRVSTSFRPE
jgi:hypothetical protein